MVKTYDSCRNTDRRIAVKLDEMATQEEDNAISLGLLPSIQIQLLCRPVNSCDDLMKPVPSRQHARPRIASTAAIEPTPPLGYIPQHG
jgi:hypothetical protein